MVLILKPELEVGYHACSVLFCRQDDVERLRAKLKKKSPDEDHVSNSKYSKIYLKLAGY